MALFVLSEPHALLDFVLTDIVAIALVAGALVKPVAFIQMMVPVLAVM
jgi:hypothetical protein